MEVETCIAGEGGRWIVAEPVATSLAKIVSTSV